jgi:hypothetical protein
MRFATELPDALQVDAIQPCAKMRCTVKRVDGIADTEVDDHL